MNFPDFQTFPEAAHYLIYETTRFISPEAIALEWVITAICGLIVALAPFRFYSFWKNAMQIFARVAERPGLAIILCGVLPVAVRLAMLGIAPVPEPSIHDEFSHLLLGDTLAHGRLANLAHPLWQHFESIHIIQRPTYSSMYPPGEGVFLALGQVLFHEPWAGVVISVGLMCAATCWMMQAWLPASWALFGTLIVILKIGLVGFWMNSYLSGAVPAIGGALLMGALPRIRVTAKPGHALLLATAFVLLMNTRPFEGGVLGLAGAIYLTPALLRYARADVWRFSRRLLAPFMIVTTVGICFTLIYCWKVTGSPLRLPYQVNRDAYGWPENLGFLPIKKVILRHASMQNMYLKEIAHHDMYRSFPRAFDNLCTRLFDNWTFLIGPLLTIPLLFLPWMFRDPNIRVLAIFLAVIATLNIFQMVLYPYHLGPVIPIIYTLVGYGSYSLYRLLQRFSGMRAWHFAGLLPIGLIMVGTVKLEAQAWDIPLSYWERAYEIHRDARSDAEHWLKDRAKKHLVIVRYRPNHDPDQEWVYNRADIDNAKIVWAREMDCNSNARLLKYFSDREVWLLEADTYPQRLTPYIEWSCSGS